MVNKNNKYVTRLYLTYKQNNLKKLTAEQVQLSFGHLVLDLFPMEMK